MSLRVNLATAKAEYEVYNEKMQEGWRKQGELHKKVEELKELIVIDEGLLIGTEWEVKGVESDRPMLVSHWKNRCFDALIDLLNPDHHSSYDFEDFSLGFSDGDMYLTSSCPLGEFIKENRLKVDWSRYTEIDSSIKELEKRIENLQNAKILAEEMMEDK